MTRIWNGFCMSYSMFTALPCPYRPWDEDARELTLVCLPIVGAVLGALWVLLGALGLRLLPGVSSAVFAALPWLLTGFIHLDGYMDTCDALLSWRPLEQRLRILKDSRTGAFAVIALGIVMMFSYAAADAVDFTRFERLRMLLFIPVVSRCCSAFCVLILDPLDHSEYARLSGATAQPLAVLVMWVIAVAVCALWLGYTAAVLVVESLAYAAAMLWAIRTLKGVSGDLAGFALVISECAALVALAHL